METEQLLVEESKKQGFQHTIIRVSGTYGIGSKSGGLFESILQMSMRNSILSRINFCGSLSLMHVEDLARCICGLPTLVLDSRESRLFIAHVESARIDELFEWTYSALGKNYKRINLPNWLFSFSKNPLG